MSKIRTTYIYDDETDTAELTELEEVGELEEEIKKLNEKIRFLEQCLDNKEKVNKSLREELENLKDNIKNQN